MGKLAAVNGFERAFCVYDGLVYRVYHVVGKKTVEGVSLRAADEERDGLLEGKGWEEARFGIKGVKKIVKRGGNEADGVEIETEGGKLAFGNVTEKRDLGRAKGVFGTLEVQEVVKSGFWSWRDGEGLNEYGEVKRYPPEGVDDRLARKDGFMKEVFLLTMDMDSFVVNVRERLGV